MIDNKYTRWFFGGLGVALMLAVILLAVMVSIRAPVTAHPSPAVAPASVALSDAVAEKLDGEYTGDVTLHSAFSGVYSDTATLTTIKDLGSIDLALALDQSGAQMTGHVVLTSTLVFSSTVVGDNGPAVSGSYDGTTLRLESERFTSALAAGRTLKDNRMLPARHVTRRFMLVSDEGTADGAEIRGEYRETFWDLLLQPITLVGTFSLRKPVFSDLNADLPLAAVFSADPVAGLPPLEVTFTDHSTGNPISWAWDFGDGGTSTEQNPTHRYEQLGVYSVQLTCINAADSDIVTRTDYIHVVEFQENIYMPVIQHSVQP